MWDHFCFCLSFFSLLYVNLHTPLYVTILGCKEFLILILILFVGKGCCKVLFILCLIL